MRDYIGNYIGKYIGNHIGDLIGDFGPEFIRNRRKRSKDTFWTCPKIIDFLNGNLDFRFVRTFPNIFDNISTYLDILDP